LLKPMAATLTKTSSRTSSRSGRMPKYQLLRTTLLEQIGSGELGSGQRVPSESELIAQFQVSNTTVRRCLNDLAKEGYIHRQRGRGSFVADLAASALRTSFGILCTSIAAGTATPSFTAQLSGLEKYASESEHRVELFTTRGLEYARNPEKALAHLIQHRELKGLFVISPIPSQWLSELVQSNFPVVSVNIDYLDLDIPRVLTDTELLVRTAAEHLIELGHRKIAGIFGEARQAPSDIPGAAVRARRGIEALSAAHAGDSIAVQSINYDYFDKEKTRKQLIDLLKPGPNRPTGLMVFEDNLGRLAWDIALESGLSVPGDLSIVSLQGLAAQLSLTTCGCNYDNLCWRAARIMEQRISGERPARLRELIGGTLVVGQSTGPCRSSK